MCVVGQVIELSVLAHMNEECEAFPDLGILQCMTLAATLGFWP